ncbi:SUF system NifU family Fe-S cluster assembly protein [soil metagenome]
MNPELDELYQQVLLDHAKRPRNFGEIAEGAVHVHGDNPSCGDEIHLHVRFGEDRGVEEIKFTGHGCAISLASASLMTMKLRGRSAAEATELATALRELVTTEVAEPTAALGDLRVLGGVRKFPQRVKCAMLPWRAFEQAQAGNAGSGRVSTEA